MSREIVVDKDKLERLVGYVYGLLEFIDVDDFEEEKNRKFVVDGFDEYVTPMMREDFLTPFAFVRNYEIQDFKEQLEDEFCVDTSKLSLNEIKELYDKVEQRIDYCTGLDRFDVINNVLREKGLYKTTVDDIIADAEDRSTVAENNDVDRDLDL